MKHSRFTKVLFALFISLSFFQLGNSQTAMAETCFCSDDGPRVRDSIIVESGGAGPWWIIDYSGKTLIPDSTLWHEADINLPGGEGYYLAPDAQYQPKDTLIDQGGGRHVLVTYRDGSVGFSGILITNGTITLPALSYPTCTPPGTTEGLAGMDTLCLGDTEMYMLTGLMASDLDTATWMFTETSTGSGSVLGGFSNTLNFTSPGVYTLEISGTTTAGCDFMVSDSILVINDIYPMTGPAFACEMGDTTSYTISGNILADYDTITWEVFGAVATFVSDSTDVDEVMIAWPVGPASARVAYTAMSSIHGCVATDTMDVMIADTLGASITGDTLLCLGDMGMYSAVVNNLDTILWTISSPMNTIIGDPRTTSIEVAFTEAGLDTIYVEGVTMMGCPVFDTIIVDVKSSDVMLNGSVNLCVGPTEIGYTAMYSDSSLADFQSISWEVLPMVGSMDTMLYKTDPTGPFDSLGVVWTEIGDYQIVVNGMTGDNCMLSDTIDVSVQDTSYTILGPALACYLDPAEYVVVQASDSTDAISNPVMWTIMRGEIGGIFTEEISMMSNDTISHGFLLGTFADPNVTYLVKVEGMSDNGCAFADSMMVNVLGRDDLAIQGPDELCAGFRDTIFYLNFPDSLFQSPPTWNVNFANGNPYSPSQWEPVGGDSLRITLPNVADTIIISLTGEIEGAVCTPTITSKQVILTDMISFDGPAVDTMCLDMDSVVFALNVDSTNINFADPFTLALYNNATNAFIQSLPVSSSGTQLATYVNWPSAGEFRVRAQGYTLDNCRINEEVVVTVKDTNYIISGDPQICLGDSTTFAFLDGSDMMPIDSTVNGDSIQWRFTFNGSSPFAFTGSGSSYFSSFSAFGAVGDSISVAFDSVGVYELFASATTDCGNCDVDAIFDLIVRGTEFNLIGPDTVCNGSTGLYNIANIDSSRIIDLVPDSTMWSLASGLNTQLSGDLQADSIFINWNRTGLYTEVYDTLYFSGMTNDGCVIRDTLPIVIETDDFIILGAGEVCVDDPILLELVNEADSSLISNLDSIIWIVNDGTDLDTIETTSIDSLDEIAMSMTWPEGGVYTIQALGTTTSGCLINETFDVTVYGVQTAEIMGDMNTCLGSVRFPTDPDVYTINIPSGDIVSINWEVISQVGAVAPDPDDDFSTPPTFGDTDEPTFTVTNWGSAGYANPLQEDYRIRVTGTTLGGCEFADSTDIIVLGTSNAFSMICNNKVNISLPHSCELVLTPDMILENWEYIRDSLNVPAEQFEVIITEESTGRTISDQGIVDGSWIGEELKVSVVHECTQQSCWGIVVLEDKNIPDLLCGRDTIGCADDYDPEDLDFGSLRLEGFPVPDTSTVTVTPIGGQINTYVVRGFEECGDATLRYQDRIEREICTGDFGTIIYRDWSMTNQAGLTSTCTDTILVERISLDSFIMMFEEQLQDTTFECGENVTGFANPSFTLDEFCFNIQYTSSEVRTNLCNDNPNTYTETKTWTFLDWCGGRVRTLQQTITVDDNTGPTINLRSNDIRTQADEHHCFGIIELDNNDISISDPGLCSDISTVRVRVFEDDITGQLIEDETFNGNFTEIIISDPNVLLDLNMIFITVEATDQCGNLSADTIARSVIVDDNVMPNAICDDIVTVNLNDEGWGLASYEAFNRGSNDNCGPVEICITRMDDLELFEGLDNDNNNLVLYSDFLDALADDLREGTNYSDRTTTVGNLVFLHRDSLCTNRLKFECIDAMGSFLGDNVLVQMTVTDINGRESTCMTEVEVRDNGVVDTVLVVRGDLQIDCDEDYSQFIPFDGDQTVRFLTNCGIPIAPDYSVDTSGLTNCGNGVITRTFTATDQIGQVFTHTQTINVGDPNDLINPDNIVGFWPQDYDGPGCPGSNIHPDNLDAQYLPDFDPADYPCSQAELYPTDIVFRNVEGYCAKVLRTWTLIDWCQMRTNDPNAGMWEYVQVFKLSDEDAPVINASAIEERSTTNANTCSAFVSLTVEADDCHNNEDLIWSYVITSDGSQVSSGASNTINSNFDVGTYTINWMAADPCGNTSEPFEQLLVIIDGVAPAMACSDVTMDFGANNSLTITADMFAGNTTDGGCTDASNLTYFFGSINGNPSMTIDCDDLAGMTSRGINLTIVAVDEQGNFADCDVTLNLTDSQNTCGNDDNVGGMDTTMTTTAELAGEITTELNFTIDDVAVSLYSGNDEMAAMSTAIDGQFSFSNVPTADSYEIKAKRDDDYLNGVTTLDLVLIQRHVLGLRLLDSPYKVIAADVDGSNSISGADLVALRKLLLGTASDLPIQQPWTFVDADQSFDNPIRPFPYAESITLTNLASDLMNLGLIGVKMGDVNENVYLESSAIAGSRSIAELNYKVSANDNGGTTIAIYSEKAMNFDGMQMELNYSELLGEITSVKSGIVALTAEDYRINGQRIAVAMAAPKTVGLSDQAILSISFSNRIEESMAQGLLDQVNSRITAELYTNEGGTISAADILLSKESIDLDEGFVLSQNSPNPFIGSTDIRFYNNIDGVISTTVYDAAGKQVYVNKAFYPTGWHKMSISSDELDGPGLYIYELNNGTAVIRKKMMALE